MQYKYLSRYEIREIIKRCLDYRLTLDEIKQTVRARIQLEIESDRYGWQ